MGGLRRTASVLPDTLQKPAILEDLKQPPHFLDVECGLCKITFKCDVAEMPETCHMRITFTDNCPKASTSQCVNEMKAVLNQIQDAGVDYVTTFDFREQPRPNMRHVGPVLAGLCDKRAKTWGRRSKSIALVVPGNMFATVANGSLAKFIEDCGLDVCPMVMCHEDAVAAEFFKNSAHGDSSAATCSSFVSVTGLREVGTACYSFLCPWSPAIQSVSGSGRSSFYGKDHEKHTRAAVEAPKLSMHTLDNGDVRVIQLPPSDVMVTKNQALTPLAGTSAVGKGPSSALQHAIEGVIFKCSPRTMKHLIGITFHLGELVIDADSESCFQRGEKLVVSSSMCNKGSSQRCNRGRKRCVKSFYGGKAPAGPFRKGGCVSGMRIMFFSLLCS